RVDALPYVVDLVGDVRADVQGHATDERGDEEKRIECAFDRGQRAARGDGHGRRGEREGSRDLPERADLIACALCEGLALRTERDARGRADLGGSVEQR